MGARHMQGVPAHLEYLHTDNSSRTRRDKRNCKFYTKEDKLCNCVECIMYKVPCATSRHCEYYISKKRTKVKGELL